MRLAPLLLMHPCLALQELLASGYLSPADVRVVVGDSAWVPQQLEGEVARGTWAVARCGLLSTHAVVFSEDGLPVLHATQLAVTAGRTGVPRDSSMHVSSHAAHIYTSHVDSAIFATYSCRVTPDFLDLFSAVPPAAQPAQPAAQSAQSGEGGPGGPLGAMFAALDRSAAAVSARAYEDRMWGKCLRWDGAAAGKLLLLPVLPAACLRVQLAFVDSDTPCPSHLGLAAAIVRRCSTSNAVCLSLTTAAACRRCPPDLCLSQPSRPALQRSGARVRGDGQRAARRVAGH